MTFEKLMNFKYFSQAVEVYKKLSNKAKINLTEYQEVEDILELHQGNIDEAYKYTEDYWKAREEYVLILKELEFEKFSYFYNLVDSWKIKPPKPPKIDTNIYFITIAPPPSEETMTLIKTTTTLKNHHYTEHIYGVFELGSVGGNFHTHFFIEFNNTKGLELYKKKMKIGKGLTPLFSNTLEKIKCSSHLLLKLRYLHKQEKKNVGYLNKDDFKYFSNLTNDTVKIHFTEGDYKGIRYNV